MSFDEDQCDLVWESEVCWFEGLRHKGVSGDLTETILLNYLKRKFPELYFFKGIVKGVDLKGEKLRESKELSNQVDVIVSKEKPLFEKAGYGITTKDKVLLTIEVKKWVAPKDFTGERESKENEPHNQQVLRLKAFTGKPVLYVGFRYHERKRKGLSPSWKEIIEKHSKADATFLFSSRNKGCPCEVMSKQEFLKNHIYKGELERLMKTITTLCKEFHRD